MHAPVAVQHRWLCAVIRGHYAYYGLPSNWHRLASFRDEAQRHWFRVLSQRSQRGMTWPTFAAMLERFPLPSPRVTHPRNALVA
jgi:RNA-directed DNA polymerase